MCVCVCVCVSVSSNGAGVLLQRAEEAVVIWTGIRSVLVYCEIDQHQEHEEKHQGKIWTQSIRGLELSTHGSDGLRLCDAVDLACFRTLRNYFLCK